MDDGLIEVECTSCKRQYRARLAHAGKTARCKCGAAVAIPARSDKQNSLATALVACMYCGFQDSGNFCSNCGGRLNRERKISLASCKVPQEFIDRLTTLASALLDDPLSPRDAIHRVDIAQSACEEFNNYITDLEIELEHGDPHGSWRTDRAHAARMVERLPKEVPGRNEIVDRLWRVIGEAEHNGGLAHIEALAESVEEALDEAAVPRATKLVTRLKTALAYKPHPDVAAKVQDYEARIRSIETQRSGAKQTAQFQKLLDKADRYAFLGEPKKAVKAWQECLFWLSRNEVEGGDSLAANVRQKIASAAESPPARD